MQDYKVKIYTRRAEISLYKRGLEKLENTRDAYGVSLLDKLIYIFENSELKAASLSEIRTLSEEANKIVDIYENIYFPDTMEG